MFCSRACSMHQRMLPAVTMVAFRVAKVALACLHVPSSGVSVSSMKACMRLCRR